MNRYRGGEQVTRGVYWSLRSGAFFQAPLDGLAFPGESAERYVRVPVFLVMVVGPLMGLVFVFFLPLVGIVGLVTSLELCLVRLSQRGLSAARRAAIHRSRERRADTPNLPQNPPDENVEVWLQNLNRRVKK